MFPQLNRVKDNQFKSLVELLFAANGPENPIRPSAMDCLVLRGLRLFFILVVGTRECPSPGS
jgi:hypothetical protein